MEYYRELYPRSAWVTPYPFREQGKWDLKGYVILLFDTISQKYNVFKIYLVLTEPSNICNQGELISTSDNILFRFNSAQPGITYLKLTIETLD